MCKGRTKEGASSKGQAAHTLHSTLAGQIIDQISLCSRKPAIFSFEEGGGSSCECLPGLPSMTLFLLVIGAVTFK